MRKVLAISLVLLVAIVATATAKEIERTVPQELVSEGCLLCSEDKPHHCHRRLVAEYLDSHWGNVEIVPWTTSSA